MEDLMQEAFNRAIIEELLKEINPDITEEKIQEVWKICNGNPWNAPVLYKIIELKNE